MKKSEAIERVNEVINARKGVITKAQEAAVNNLVSEFTTVPAKLRKNKNTK